MRHKVDFAAPVALRLHARDALRRARLLPVGPARNDLRQLAIGLRSLDERRRRMADRAIMDVPADEAPLAPL